MTEQEAINDLLGFARQISSWSEEEQELFFKECHEYIDSICQCCPDEKEINESN